MGFKAWGLGFRPKVWGLGLGFMATETLVTESNTAGDWLRGSCHDMGSSLE